MITLDQIRNRLIDAIETCGLTQAEIARRLNISQQTVSCYKKGEKLPALDTLANLCILLDIQPNYILGFEDAHNRQIVDIRPENKRDDKSIVLPVAARSKGNTARNITLQLTREQMQELIAEIKKETD